MGRKKLHAQLIAIRLLPEFYSPVCLNTAQLNEGKIIGTILIPIEGTTCSQLRQAINNFLDVPKEFCFLNSAGWPFDSSLEDKIFIVDCLITNIVTIQRKHKLSRIGIKLLDGSVLGFIYLNFSYDVNYVRSLIMSELGDIFDSNETFQFVDNNLWPVRRKQENELSVWDLVANNCITLIKKQIKRSLEEDEIKNDKKLKTFRNSIDVSGKERELNYHSLLISYVHREASLYAKDLKNALKKIGFKDIFLDTDDIPAGGDWQDVISEAVNNCSIFIPLVTSSYGETRWTNREAKLADDREKLIIPVSFVDKWPPDQLAIQFLTLQYIPWKTTDEKDGGSYSGHSDATWNKKSIARVANEIKKLCSNNEVSTPDSASLLDEKPSTLNFALKFNGKPLNSRKRIHGAEKTFIVISAHSKQQEFVEGKITKMLKSNGYDVWNSMNLCNCDENSFSPLEDSHPVNSPLFDNSYINNNIGHSSNSEKSLKRIFKEKVKAAKLVVLVFSEDYVKSSICCQQAFYCEQRKKNLVIKFDNFHIESPLSNLYPEQEMIAKENWEWLTYKIQEKLKNIDYENSYWCSVNLLVAKLKTSIDTRKSVYIIGATYDITKCVEEFCQNLGNELAKVKNLNVVTGGSKGVGDIVGRNFCEEQEIMNKGQAPKVFHIIPEDSCLVSSNEGSIEKLPYGKTLHYGVSTANRDDVVANAFKLCLLIAGGEDATCLAAKFLFNDCTVVPIMHHYSKTSPKCFKDNLTKVPDNVDQTDWNNLKNKMISQDERVRTVRRIICAILNI